jgi:FKBP-type peptidyl-prolyl cis-trans isomerase
MTVKRLLVLLSAFALVGCLDVSGPGPSNPANESFDSSLGIDLKDPSWKVTPTGTYYKDEIVGTGAALVLSSPDDSIYVDYSGWTKDGKLFDSGVNAQLPAYNIILGFLDGMVDMNVGGQRLVVIPSNLGYGNASEPGIPPNSTLIFRIKLNRFTSL